MSLRRVPAPGGSDEASKGAGVGDWAGLGILLFGAGGTLWALRMVLRNRLITVASHDEHMKQWADQVAGLRDRLKDQDLAHQEERARDNERTQARISEIRDGYEERINDRDARIRELALQLERLWHALSLTDEAFQQVTTGRIHEYGAALRTMARVLQASPLADSVEGSTATVGADDDGRPGTPDAGQVD
jgi:hypothetical protein